MIVRFFTVPLNQEFQQYLSKYKTVICYYLVADYIRKELLKLNQKKTAQ